MRGTDRSSGPHHSAEKGRRAIGPEQLARSLPELQCEEPLIMEAVGDGEEQMRKSRSHGPKSLGLEKSRVAGPIWVRGSRLRSLWEMLVLSRSRGIEKDSCKSLKTKTIPFKGYPGTGGGALLFFRSFAQPVFVETKVLFLV